MASMVINPCREKGEKPIAATGILLVNPAEARQARHLARQWPTAERFLFNSRLVQIEATDSTTRPCFIAGPAIGAPMAVLALEKLIALGARRIILYGWCGSLSPSLKIGDLLLPTRAKSGEGTSAHYPINCRPESTGTLRQSINAFLTDQGYTPDSGPVWTTDAPYREDRDTLAALAGRGILGVDMEYAALCSVAIFRGVELAALLMVSDSLLDIPWKPGYNNKKFRQRSTALIQAALDYCRSDRCSATAPSDPHNDVGID